MHRLFDGVTTVALIAHLAPDMDTLASCAALQFLLEQAGFQVQVYCQDPVPPRYLFLKGLERTRGPQAAPATVDLAIAVDTADEERLGDCLRLFQTAGRTLVIDHHPTNRGFGQSSIVRPGCAATAEILVGLCKEWGLPLIPEAAMCLYAGLSTDTGNFSFESVTANTLQAAAACVAAGAQPERITRELYRTRTSGHVRLLGQALSSLALLEGGRLALLTLKREDFARCGALESDIEGIVNYGVEMENVQAAALISEREGAVKCSLRSKAPLDVAAVASRLGGGGHARAAGVSFMGQKLEQAKALVLAALREALA